MLSIIFFTGCSFTSNQPTTPQNETNQTVTSSVDFSEQMIGEIIDEDNDREDKKFGSFFKKYLNTRAGGDCSGFVSIVNAKYQNMYFAQHPGFPGLNDVDGGNVPKCVQEVVDTYIKTGKYVYEMNAMVNVASPILPELWKFYVEMSAGIKTPEQVLKAWDVLYSDYMKARKESGF